MADVGPAVATVPAISSAATTSPLGLDEPITAAPVDSAGGGLFPVSAAQQPPAKPPKRRECEDGSIKETYEAPWVYVYECFDGKWVKVGRFLYPPYFP